jgi:ABC-type glycerol-3-phosphate transport system substrate-binding protein
MKHLIHAATAATALAASIVLSACGGGSDADSDTPTERLPLGNSTLKLNAQPYRNEMPIAYTPGSTACLNLIVPVQVVAVEGPVPSGITVRAVRLRNGNEDVWRATVAEADRGPASGTARGCPTSKTAPGMTVRVIAELDTAAGARQLYTDAKIEQAF